MKKSDLHYDLPDELPSPALYLRTKFQDLSPRQLKSLEREMTDLLARHGIDPTEGPTAGEDEQPEPAPRSTTKSRTTKGGNS